MRNLKSAFLMMGLLFPLISLAQMETPVKKIEVTGTADMEVTPDEIYVRITLKEYVDDRRKKVELDKLEERLVKALKSERIPEEDLTVENIYGYNWDWRKQRSGDFMASKSYRLKVNDLKKINDLLERLDEKGISNMNIDNFTHSKLDQYQRDLKLKALQNAKEKAAFLLQGIDEQLGGVLEVTEYHTGPSQPILYKARALEAADAVGYQSDLEFKTIKLQAEMRAVFSIQ